MEITLFPITVLILFNSIEGHTHSFKMNKGVIVHLFEWKYSDIALECEEFLSRHGFKGIQISPPAENRISPGRPWWERYQPVSYQLITRSGTEQELMDMLTRCNKVGIRVFADVVFNHMTDSQADCLGTGNSTCDPSSLSYPAVPYTSEDFHHPECGINDYNNASEVRNCDLVALHDLNQTRENVRQKIVDHLNHLIDIGVAGFRVDAAKHMYPADLEVIYSRLHHLNKSHGFRPYTTPFIYQEVTDMGGEAVKYQEYTPLGLVTDMRYGKELSHCFQGNNDLKWLVSFGATWNLLPSNESIVFIENHDTERQDDNNILNYKNSQSYKMAVAFMLAWNYGSPKVLSSYKFTDFNQGPPEGSPRFTGQNICINDWVCQHRWHQVYNMVAFHNIVQDAEVNSWWDNGKNQIAFCRGNKGFIAFNLEGYPLNQTLQTCLPRGSYCDIISGNLNGDHCTGKTVYVEDDGRALINIAAFDPNSPDDGVLAIHVKAKSYKA